MSGSLRAEIAEGLSLAAAPTFGFMALASALWGGPMDALCRAGSGFVVGGMTQMYLLMIAFHLAPWLRRAAGQ